jgi:hypothetical protein
MIDIIKKHINKSEDNIYIYGHWFELLFFGL